MMYFVDNIVLPLNSDEKDIKNAIRDKLNIRSRSFRYEVLRKEVEYEPLLLKSHLRYAFSVDTPEFVRNTSISFLPERDTKQWKYASRLSPVVITSEFFGLLFAYFLAKCGAKPIVLCQDKRFADRQSKQGGFLHFKDPNTSRDIADMYRLFLKNNVPLPGAFKAYSPREFTALVSSFCDGIEKAGGTIIYEAKPLAAFNILGRFRKIVYEVNGEQREIKTRHVILLDQGKNVSFYTAIKARKTKSDLRLRLFVETKKKDVDLLIYGNTSGLPTYFARREYSDRSESGVKVMLPISDYSLSNLSEGQNPDVDVVFSSERRQTALAIVDLSLGSNIDVYRAALSSCKKLSLPFSAPCQKIDDFLSSRETFHLGTIKSAYSKGVYLDNFHSLLPPESAEALKMALSNLKKEYPFFHRDAILLGVSGHRFPGDVSLGKGYEGFVYAYWFSELEELDLGTCAEFALSKAKEFLDRAR